MKKTLTCIICPIGCQLEVELDGEKVTAVTGNTCKRGAEYAESECTDPRRIITTTVKTVDGRIIPVKTDKAVPKNMIFECMKAINGIHPQSDKGFSVGDVIESNILNTGADILVCANVQGA